MDNKAREVNNPLIEELINETTPEELAKIDTVMTNNKQQTAVEWFHQKTWALKIQLEKGEISIGEYANTYATLYEQSKEMEKEQMAVEIQKFVYKVNEKIDRELGWCGGPRNKSFEMENWRKAYANVRKWMQNLNKEFQQTYGGGEQ